ncbi:MAG: hypothetical protein SF172_08470 [Burkholderiales bacterium]|nr:hypothetical protein [Burkholderiales bacterium]
MPGLVPGFFFVRHDDALAWLSHGICIMRAPHVLRERQATYAPRQCVHPARFVSRNLRFVAIRWRRHARQIKLAVNLRCDANSGFGRFQPVAVDMT